MDSGVTHSPPPDGCTTPFNPYAELLPEEVCWIIDRSIAAEASNPATRSKAVINANPSQFAIYQISWHSGNSLAQTIFTLLYMHDLPNLQNNYLFYSKDRTDRDRPEELVTEVLRAATFGLVKSCDLVWREFSKNHVYDVGAYHSLGDVVLTVTSQGEDFNGEKFDISMCESHYFTKIIVMLDEAIMWLEYGLGNSHPARN